eukprot:Em0427g1a
MSMDDSDSNEESPEQDYSKKPLLKDSEKAENDQDKDEELLALETSKAEKRRRWISIYIMYFTMFLSSIIKVRPVQYRKDVQVRGRPTREPLMVSLLINLIFNVLYAYAGAFPSAVAGYVLLVSRFFVGFGAVGVCLYVGYWNGSKVSCSVGLLTEVVVIFVNGEIVPWHSRIDTFLSTSSPPPPPSSGVGLCPPRLLEVSPYGPSDSLFNIYTGPGYLNAGLGIINLVLLFFVQNIKAQSFTTTTTSTMTVNSNPAEKKMVKVTAGFVSPLSLDEFAWSKNHAVLYNNIMFAAMAVISVATFIGIKIRELQE